MELVAFLLAAAVAVIAIALVALPLVRGAALPVEDAREGWSDLARLREQRNAVLQAVQDLDEEAARGNVTPEEHRTLRAGYVRQAALLIREIEGREQVLDEEIDRAVELYRQRTTIAAAASTPKKAGRRTE
jgi:hypothetical protein